jgi:hypothetical protein
MFDSGRDLGAVSTSDLAAGTAPIDGYEVAPRLRAAVRYWQVADARDAVAA